MKRIGKSYPLKWTVTQLDKRTGEQVGDELPARVPGDVFSDLMAAGVIPDPYPGLNSCEVQWVNDYDWLYRGRAGELSSTGERFWLEFMGLDYRYVVKWNGKPLADREGMFSRLLLEVKPEPDRQNAVEVRFSGIPDHWTETRLPPIIFNTEPVRRRRLKTAMSFGWDFAPRLKGCGIWDEASLFSTGPVMIDDLWVRPKNDGSLDLQLTLDSSEATKALIELSIDGHTFTGLEQKESVGVSLIPGRNVIDHQLKLEDPKLWWPRDQGTPELYRLTLAVTVNGKVSDAALETFGVRELEWTRNPGSPASALDWTLVVNGRRVFLKGANVVPFDSMAGRNTDERCVKLLEMARDANLNAIRLWGGGNRERALIYETCDRLGLLVWQEFPIGCINLGTPRSKKYLKLLLDECSEIVRQLRNRPCLFMWCGGNEFNVRLSGPAIKTMKKVAAKLDPDRRFVPASPYRGDAHNWLVWHMKGNLADYLNDRSQLVSEFGLQAPPALESLKAFLPGDLLWPIGKAWAHHHLGRAKMEKYVKHFGGLGQGLEDFINAGQEAQAYYLQRGIEHWRRDKYKKSGALFWQWNEPWPCISWSVVDYYLRPKKAYAAVRLAFSPLLISAEFEQKRYRPGEAFNFRLFAVNDLPRYFRELEVEVLIHGKSVNMIRGSVGPDQVAMLGEVSVNLPAAAFLLLTLVAREAGQEVSRNCYDLAQHDPKPASWLGRRIFRRWWQFLTE